MQFAFLLAISRKTSPLKHHQLRFAFFLNAALKNVIHLKKQRHFMLKRLQQFIYLSLVVLFGDVIAPQIYMRRFAFLSHCTHKNIIHNKKIRTTRVVRIKFSFV